MIMDEYIYGILIVRNKYKNLKDIKEVLIQFVLIMMELF